MAAAAAASLPERLPTIEMHSEYALGAINQSVFIVDREEEQADGKRSLVASGNLGNSVRTLHDFF